MKIESEKRLTQAVLDVCWRQNDELRFEYGGLKAMDMSVLASVIARSPKPVSTEPYLQYFCVNLLFSFPLAYWVAVLLPCWKKKEEMNQKVSLIQNHFESLFCADYMVVSAMHIHNNRFLSVSTGSDISKYKHCRVGGIKVTFIVMLVVVLLLLDWMPNFLGHESKQPECQCVNLV